MTVSHKHFTAVVLAAMAIMSPAWGQTPEEIQKIENAVPAKASVKPKKERRVLVFSLALKYKHSAIPYGEQAFKIMGEKTGAYQVDLSMDPEDLTAENLKKYDAIIFNNTTGDFITTESARQGLLEFVRSGKGIVGIHAASDSNFGWPEYGRLIGGFFENHPWRASDTVTIKVERPKHPLMKAFDAKTFTVNDEIYQFKEPYNRDNLLVLASLDTDKTDMNKEGINRTDNDFAISWVQPYGKGRVFYCSLGHNHHIFWNPTILQHYLDGIQFAVGDLNAPHRPNKGDKGARKGKGKKANKGGGAEAESTAGTTASVSMAEVEKAFEGLRGYDFGTDRAFLLVLDEAIRQTAGNEEQRNRLANAFAEVAADDSLTFAAREVALRRLGEMGAGKQVEQIEKVLANPDEKLAERARQAIESIPGERSDKALLDALGKSSGSLKIGIIHALGNRQVNSAIKPLTEIARGNNADEARAAMKALGDIANGDAANALDQLRPADDVREAWFMALNDAAASLAEKNPKLAERLYSRVMELGGESPARLAAFKGVALLSGNPESLALKTLDEGDPVLGQVARELLVRGKDESITTQLKERLANAAAEKKIAVIEILGARGDKTVLPEIQALGEKAESEEVQVAALRALENLGDEKMVPQLVKVAAEAKGAVADAAEATLKEMPVPEVDPELLRLANEAASPDEKVVAMEAAAARKSPEAMPALIKAAGSEDDKVAIAAFKAAGEVLTYKDLAALLKAHGAATADRVLKEGSRTIIAAAREYKKPEDAVTHVVKAYENAPSDDVRASLLGVLGELGTPKALETLRANVTSDNEKLREGAVRGLAQFPDASALDDLMKIASESDSQVHRVLAVRGVARLLGESNGKPASERLAMAQKALELAGGPEEKKAIIGALGEMKIPGVLPMLLPFVDQEEFKQEAAAAIIAQAPVANAFNADETAQLLNPLSDKLERPQWEKLEEALTPSEESAAAIRAWQATKLYTLDGATSLSAVLEHEFEPETGGGEWTNAVWGSKDDDDNKGQVDLEAYYPGAENAVVYLRQHIWSPDERKVELQTGSDDGLRVWVNGAQVFAHDDPRGFTWWGDKTPITLKRGWNTLLLKVGNGGNGYSVAARIVGEDDKPVQDLKYSAVPAGE